MNKLVNVYHGAHVYTVRSISHGSESTCHFAKEMIKDVGFDAAVAHVKADLLEIGSGRWTEW